MCTEWYYKSRQCNHTRFWRWEYCKEIEKEGQKPENAKACALFTDKFRDSQQSWNCYECIRKRGDTVQLTGKKSS
ncbi:uncharacterized protein K441DRAFT_561017 [Cenococcum geophilum 1.58]|uniref:uncharacterized protein n=1 Tax=Cenococcum geophilum 1.58 TaxID=794803 RepID=UPI00358FBD2E|nr:hypothetical protein K441DRAFT_561017 [Cenococcum geophilum 1.58]